MHHQAVFHSLTLADEWETFGGSQQHLPAASHLLGEEETFSLSAEGTISDVLQLTWNELRQHIGEEKAEGLLESLIDLAQSDFLLSQTAPRPARKDIRHILEKRWAECSLASLGLSYQTNAVLAEARLGTFGEMLQLVDRSTNVLMYDFPAFKEVWEKLVDLELRQGAALSEWERRVASTECHISLDHLVTQMYTYCGKSWWGILTRRYGIDSGEETGQKINQSNITYSTLETIGKERHLSRERVRQIEQKSLKALRTAEGKEWSGLAKTLAFWMQNAGGVMSVEHAVSEVTRRFPAQQVNPRGVCWLLLEISDEIAPIIEGEIYCLRLSHREAVKPMIERAKHMAQWIEWEHSEEEFLQQIQTAFAAENRVYDLAFVRACVRASGCLKKTEIHRNLPSLISEVLYYFNRPAHFTEIAQWLVSKHRVEYVSEKMIYNCLLTHHDLFVTSGAGVYELPSKSQKLELHDCYEKTIGDIAEIFLLRKNQPMDFAEIAAFVRNYKPCQQSLLWLYLSQDQRFHYFGEDRYGLRYWCR